MKASITIITLTTLAILSGLGLVLAVGNLMTLPSIQAQLVEAVPEATEAVEQAVSASSRNSYYGVMVCLPVFLVTGCVLILRWSRRGRKR